MNRLNIILTRLHIVKDVIEEAEKKKVQKNIKQR